MNTIICIPGPSVALHMFSTISEGVWRGGRPWKACSGPDWRLCPPSSSPKTNAFPSGLRRDSRGAGLLVLPHFRHLTRAWARGTCSGKQKAGQVSWWGETTRQDVNCHKLFIAQQSGHCSIRLTCNFTCIHFCILKTIKILPVGLRWYKANACALTTTASDKILGGLWGML